MLYASPYEKITKSDSTEKEHKPSFFGFSEPNQDNLSQSGLLYVNLFPSLAGGGEKKLDLFDHIFPLGISDKNFEEVKDFEFQELKDKIYPKNND